MTLLTVKSPNEGHTLFLGDLEPAMEDDLGGNLYEERGFRIESFKLSVVYTMTVRFNTTRVSPID